MWCNLWKILNILIYKYIYILIFLFSLKTSWNHQKYKVTLNQRTSSACSECHYGRIRKSSCITSCLSSSHKQTINGESQSLMIHYRTKVTWEAVKPHWLPTRPTWLVPVTSCPCQGTDEKTSFSEGCWLGGHTLHMQLHEMKCLRFTWNTEPHSLHCSLLSAGITMTIIIMLIITNSLNMKTV